MLIVFGKRCLRFVLLYDGFFRFDNIRVWDELIYLIGVDEKEIECKYNCKENKFYL